MVLSGSGRRTWIESVVSMMKDEVRRFVLDRGDAGAVWPMEGSPMLLTDLRDRWNDDAGHDCVSSRVSLRTKSIMGPVSWDTDDYYKGGLSFHRLSRSVNNIT